MKSRSLVIIALVFFALMAYIVSFEMPRSEQRLSEQKPFHSIGKAEVAALKIKKADEVIELLNGEPRNALKRSERDEETERLSQAVSPEKWTLEGVPGHQVDNATLNGILTQLSSFELGDALPPKELDADMSRYGLDKPPVILTTEVLDEYGSRKQLGFEFGKKSDFLGKRYVRYTRPDKSQAIFLVDDLLFFAANKSQKDFRRKDPVSFEDSVISGMEISGADQSNHLVLELKPAITPGERGQQWRLAQPLSASADQAKVAEVLRNLKSLRAKDFFDGEAAKERDKLFDRPFLSVQLSASKDKKPTVIKIASDKQGDKDLIYFSMSNLPTVFEAETNTLAGLTVDAQTFRRKKFFEIEVDDVQSFDLGGTAVSSFKGEKKGDGWALGDKTGDNAFIRQWFLDLKSLEAQAFPSEVRDFGFAMPTYRLSLKLKDILGSDETLARVLVVGAPSSTEAGKPKAYFAAVDDLAEPFIISADSLAKITPKPETLIAVPTPQATIAPSPSPAS